MCVCGFPLSKNQNSPCILNNLTILSIYSKFGVTIAADKSAEAFDVVRRKARTLCLSTAAAAATTDNNSNN